MARSYKLVTTYAKLFTIAVWMEVPNSHLPSGSLRGWLLATGEGRCRNPPQSPSRHPVVKAVWTCDASKQRLVARHVAAPPAESPDSLTLSYLCLAPTLQPGRDVLGSNAAH